MRWCVLLFVLCLAGCDDKDSSSPSDATRQVEQARQEVQHQQRLRDLERHRLESQIVELQGVWGLWRVWLGGLAVLMVILLVWLAREVRHRRVLAHILLSLRRNRSGGGGS